VVEGLAAGFFAADFFATDFFATDFFATDFFAADFLTELFLVALFFAAVFFVTGRFTVRLRVVAMVASWCEEHAEVGCSWPGGPRASLSRLSVGTALSP
jgi:hypothetical protein